MSASLIKNANPAILRACREQINMDIAEVKKKVASIIDIEAGEKHPTINQLDRLSELYLVPRWIFINETLPPQYQFNKTSPAFRKFTDSNSEIFESTEIRKLTIEVEQLRDFIITLRAEMDEAVAAFMPPELPRIDNAQDTAQHIRRWLGATSNCTSLEWKVLLEKKNIFVFMTNKYTGRFHVDKKMFRGLSIYHATLPIIIINDNDAKKAQSFTLMHELGHLLRRENALDDWNENHRLTEKWCDELAGNILMPAPEFHIAAQHGMDDLTAIDEVAARFKVSKYACLVRARQLKIITQSAYDKYFHDLETEYQAAKKKSGFANRNRAKEVRNQYGSIYTHAIFQAYHNQEIGLHKLCKLFGLKQTAHALEIETAL